MPPDLPDVQTNQARLLSAVTLAFWLVLAPLALGAYVLKVWRHDLSIPFYYDGTDSIWQFTLTKLVRDTGWILTNPFMGAPGVAQWYANPAAQASALHSVLLRIVGLFAPDAVATQQAYYILNFPLITLTTYAACRLLGIRRLFAVCIGLLYAFLPARFNMIAYAFLSNYFMVPLSIVPAIWILTGRFAALATDAGGQFTALWRIAVSRFFLISLAITITVAVTDGYYAFFALLLQGLAIALRTVLGDWRRPPALVMPVVLSVAIMGTALLVTSPLRAYQHTHPDEFAPGGIPDPAYQRNSFEAVAYSSALMVLLAPSDQHRVPALRQLGAHIVGNSNLARLYPISQGEPLGTLGSGLFLAMLTYVATSLVRGRDTVIGRFAIPPEQRRMLGAIIVLALFVTGCSIFGGFGALIALIYPTIRAYDRFALFLSFLLFAGAGVVMTGLLDRWNSPARRIILFGVTALVTLLALLDQVPNDPLSRGAGNSRFLAERTFIRQIEASLPDRAMIYQKPYSNYLTNNRYYGWGSFADMRFYLHSHYLRWSSGASKNSPVDMWHARLAQLPIEERLPELQAAGFQGLLVDRTVVTDGEYSPMRAAIIAITGRQPVEDPASSLAFWSLPDPGYRLEYGPDFVDPVRLVVTDRDKLNSESLSQMVRRGPLMALLASSTGPVTIQRAAHPEIFRDTSELSRGLGLTAIPTPPGMAGDVSCPDDTGRTLLAGQDHVTLRVKNRSDFPWSLNGSGPLPIRIGLMELRAADGSRIRWDGGFRVPGRVWLAAGGTIEVAVPLSGIDLRTGVVGPHREMTAVFALLQEGNAWFGAPSGNGECHVTVAR